MTLHEIKANFGLPVTYLNPSRLIPANGRSKMGGDETYLIPEIDICPSCQQKRTLILELFKDEFPETFFPSNTDYLQVKTCYNDQCIDISDIVFKLGFGKILDLSPNRESMESHIPTVYFEPIFDVEIPYDTYESIEQLGLIKLLGVNKYEELIGEFTAKIGTKINGDIFVWHPIDIPKCSCGRKMSQFLQISSYEPCLQPEEDSPYWEWDPSLGVFIGKVGNYHFFTCKFCNNEEVEYRWDDL